eukprot:scaffold8043_cov151-Skeletonema_menzelii.AAC.3
MRAMLHCGWRKGTTFHSMAWQNWQNKMNRGNDLSVSGATYKHQIEVERMTAQKNWRPRRFWHESWRPRRRGRESWR